MLHYAPARAGNTRRKKYSLCIGSTAKRRDSWSLRRPSRRRKTSRINSRITVPDAVTWPWSKDESPRMIFPSDPTWRRTPLIASIQPGRKEPVSLPSLMCTCETRSENEPGSRAVGNRAQASDPCSSRRAGLPDHRRQNLRQPLESHSPACTSRRISQFSPSRHGKPDGVRVQISENVRRTVAVAAVVRRCEKIAFTTCQMSNVCCAMFNVVVKTPDDLLTKPPNPQWETIESSGHFVS